MTFQSSLIAPFQTGLDINNEPWMSPADAFSVADNVHIFNGYIEKRNGFRIYGRLQERDISVAISGITNAANGEVTTAVNHGYSNGDIVYLNNILGMTELNGLFYTITVTALDKFELNIDTSLYGIYAGGGDSFKLIDSTERVMGIYQFIENDGSRTTLAFSKKRAYKFDSIVEKFLPLDNADIMDGDETDYIWAINLQSSSLKNRLYFTNGKVFDGTLNGIRYYDSSGTGFTTVQFTPDLGGGRKLYGAKLLFSLKERLIVMHTFENSGATTTTHFQRQRWCQAQGPSNWNDLTPGGGGFVDAPTGDHIISGRTLQDQIMVYFSQGVWASQPVSDPALPFRWTKLNDFRACDSKMGSIGYDRYTMAFGTRGITATDGADTQRIDGRISDFVSSEININEFEKVFCARSFNNRRTWILYPELESDENSAALIFDEDSQAYTTYTISINCLGYGSLSQDLVLSDFTALHDLDLSLDDFDVETLTNYVWQGKEELLLGGDISGTVYIMETDGSDNGVSIDTTLTTAGWNPFLSQDSQAYFSYLDIYVDTSLTTTAKIDFYKDDEDSPYITREIDFLPNLDYLVAIQSISQTNPGIVTAANHGLSSGNIVYIYGVKGMTQINDIPLEITVIDKDSFSIGINTIGYGLFTTGGCVYRRKFYKTKVFKRAFAGGVGYIHKVKITSSGVNCPFRISGFKPVFKPRGKRLVN